jgi:hypothetical protein
MGMNAEYPYDHKEIIKPMMDESFDPHWVALWDSHDKRWVHGQSITRLPARRYHCDLFGRQNTLFAEKVSQWRQILSGWRVLYPRDDRG